MKLLTIEIPLVTKSLNLREHHMARHRRVKSERGALRRRWPGWNGGPLLVITLTRIAPRKLDPGDNLSSALKAVRDEVAACLRLDDASPLVRWEYEQEKGATPTVRVEVSLPGHAAGTAATYVAPSAGAMMSLIESVRRAPSDLAAIATPNVRRPR